MRCLMASEGFGRHDIRNPGGAGCPGVKVAGRLAGKRGSLGRVAEGARTAALVALGAYCTRVGC